MNKFVTGALALAVAGSAANAEPVNSDWLELDSEINTLASSMAATGDYTNIKVLLRGGYTYGDDEPISGSKDVSTSGVRFWDAAIAGGAEIGDVAVRLGFDFARHDSVEIVEAPNPFSVDLSATLEDAYAMWHCGNDIDVVVGHYKPHITLSNTTDPENLFFLERSAIGASYDHYDMGFGARGKFGDFGWNVDIMNLNGIESGHLYLLRACWVFGMPVGGWETQPEDAFGAGDDPTGVVGVFYHADDVWNGQYGDTSVFGLDGHGTYGQFGWFFEITSRDDDAGDDPASPFAHTTSNGWNGLAIPLNFAGDSTPWMLGGTYQMNDQYGFGIRYENLDNDGELYPMGPNGADNTVLTLGANMYNVGHNGKLGLNIAMINADASGAEDATVFQAGYTYGASR